MVIGLYVSLQRESQHNAVLLVHLYGFQPLDGILITNMAYCLMSNCAAILNQCLLSITLSAEGTGKKLYG